MKGSETDWGEVSQTEREVSKTKRERSDSDCGLYPDDYNNNPFKPNNPYNNNNPDNPNDP